MVRSRTLIFLLIPAVLVSGLFCLFAFTWWNSNRYLNDPEWLRTTSPDEMRDTAHRVIRLPVGNHHDAFLVLMRTGNAESIPLLVKALRWHDPDGSGFIPCTTDHCLEALRNLTGHDAGPTAAQWRHWWAETGSNRDPASFFPRDQTPGATDGGP